MTLGEIDSALTTGHTTAFKDSPAGALYLKLTSERYLFTAYLLAHVRTVLRSDVHRSALRRGYIVL